MVNRFFHILTAFVLTVLLVLLSDLFMIWMPKGAQMVILLSLTVTVCLWAGLVVYEKAEDEREILHRLQAGQVAYVTGLSLLTTALVVQGINHAIDPWISGTLLGMVLSKLVARLFTERYR